MDPIQVRWTSVNSIGTITSRDTPDRGTTIWFLPITVGAKDIALQYGTEGEAQAAADTFVANSALPGFYSYPGFIVST